MEQIILIRIISILTYTLILSIMIINLIKNLITGKVSTGFLALTNKRKERFKQKYKTNFKNNTITTYKKDNPEGYWQGIIINILLICFGLMMGYLIYLKVF